MGPHFRRSVMSLAAVLFCFTTVPAFAQEELSDRTFTFVGKPSWTTPSKSQGRTGTCWCFSTTSLIETEAYRKGLGEFNISEIYTVTNAYIEKGLRYLRLQGKNSFGQGGLSHDFALLVPKYGLMQKSDYSGMLPEQTGHNHGPLFMEMRTWLEETLKAGKGLPADWMATWVGIIEKHLGARPQMVTVGDKTMTPQEFARDVVKFDPADYVEITSFLHLPMWWQGELLVPDNWVRYEGYYNIPLDDFIAVMDHALKTGYSMVLDFDVSEKTNQGRRGVSWMPHDLNGTVVTAEEREKMFDTFATTDDHLVHTVGLATDQDGKKYYYTKDSGGPERGPYQGFVYISENYVRAKVLAIYLHKDGVPQDVRAKLGF